MKLFYNSLYSKICCAIRARLIDVRYFNRSNSKPIRSAGPNVEYYIEKNGTICHGKKNAIANNVMIYSKGKLSFGDWFFVNSYSKIICHEEISIGNNVTIASNVSIFDHDHAFEFSNDQLVFDKYNTQAIFIGDNVWIGEKATILKGAKIGSNVIIAAGAVVNSEIPANCIAGGIPSKVIKKLI